MSDKKALATRLGDKRVTDTRRDRIFVRGLVLDCAIGAYDEEKGITQKVSFTVEAEVEPRAQALGDALADVPSYDDIIKAVTAETTTGHINLVETLAERIAARCLGDRRITVVSVRVEKLERGPAGVGVEIERRQPRA